MERKKDTGIDLVGIVAVQSPDYGPQIHGVGEIEARKNEKFKKWNKERPFIIPVNLDGHRLVEWKKSGLIFTINFLK